MGIILTNVIFTIIFWGGTLLYKPRRNKSYVSFSWFITIIFGIITYYLAINYFFRDYLYNTNASNFTSNIFITTPLIFMYTFLGVFVKEKIYKKRSIIYPIMLILGILIFMLIFLNELIWKGLIWDELISLFVSGFLHFGFAVFEIIVTMICFIIVIIITIISSIAVAIILGVKKDDDDYYFEKKNTNFHKNNSKEVIGIKK